MGQSVARRGKSDEDAIDAKGNLYDWIDRGVAHYSLALREDTVNQG